jgi:hypothetical protein
MVALPIRSVAVVLVLGFSASAFATEGTDPMTPPTQAVALAWAKEAEQRGPSAIAFKFNYGSYAAVTTLDLISTIASRQHGAREINPLMSGSYGQVTAVKAAFAAGTIVAVKALTKKSRRGAFITLLAVNAATTAVAVNNLRYARRVR